MAELIGGGALGDGTGEFGGTVHRHGRSIVWVEAAVDSCVLADTGDFRQFQLSGASAQLWKRFDGQRSDAAVIADVLSLYPGHPDNAADDCVTLIAELDRLCVLESTRPEPDDVEAVERQKGAVK